ncbi:hypothetical protein [Kitasatospora cineracea]|uniref:Uncharacterized protein n=1 Tax=Kitasatospora cineracea TaxID=88074 RepID=A0A3N4R7B8_9ACTN|nr:hypothetical protein [Kitasatospora cineracea]RPE27259.1 hypothetical protein EDD38_7404 [Kitasatospora cineracea]
MTRTFSKDDVERRWPGAIAKVEMIEGALVFTSRLHPWDEQDSATAALVYPDRLIEVSEDALVVWPGTERTFEIG